MSREWKVLMKKSAGVIEKCLRRILFTRTTNQSLRLCETLATAAITRKTREVCFLLFHLRKEDYRK